MKPWSTQSLLRCSKINSSVTSLATGGWIVTWEGGGTQAGNVDTLGVFQQVYNADGTKSGGETLVNTTTAGSQIKSSVTKLAGGGWVVSWEGNGCRDW